MTPAIVLAQKNKISYKIHEYTHDASSESYGLEAAEKLGVDANRVFKTLVVDIGNKQLAVAVIPVATMLNFKSMAKSCGVKKVAMADKADVERSTGYVLGGVSPLAQKRKLKTIVDFSAKHFPTIYVSAGRRGLEIELSPIELTTVLGGLFAELAE